MVWASGMLCLVLGSPDCQGATGDSPVRAVSMTGGLEHLL